MWPGRGSCLGPGRCFGPAALIIARAVACGSEGAVAAPAAPGGLGGAEGVQCVPQPGGRRGGDLSLRPVLAEDLNKLGVLLLDLLGVLARRAEQQLLKVVEQVLPGWLGDLPAGDRGLQVADERCRRAAAGGARWPVCG